MSCDIFPCFSDMNDFDCYLLLHNARYYLSVGQVKKTVEELQKVKELHFANDKFYYQEWLYLNCKLQLYFENVNHKKIFGILIQTFQISNVYDLESLFNDRYFTSLEIEILTLIAAENLMLKKQTDCAIICKNLITYIKAMHFPEKEKNCYLADIYIVYIQYLIETKEYQNALKLSNEWRHKMVLQSENALLMPLTMYVALCNYYLKNFEEARALFDTVFYSTHAIGVNAP